MAIPGQQVINNFKLLFAARVRLIRQQYPTVLWTVKNKKQKRIGAIKEVKVQKAGRMRALIANAQSIMIFLIICNG
jgi:hypothetical protein